MEHHVLPAPGREVHFWTAGAAPAPVVAFTHGATLDHRMFDPQVSALVDAGYRCLSWDLPGHGQSLPIAPDFGVRVACGDLVAMLDSIGADRVVIAGHSFGGYVAQQLAYMHPDRVSAVVLVSCTDLGRRPSVLWRPLYWLLPAMLGRGSVEQFRRRTLAELSISEEVKAYAAEAMRGIGKDDFIAIIMAGVECLWIGTGIAADYRIGKPFLLAVGAQDNANGAVFRRQAPAWLAKEPNCRYEIIPDAGHTANMDNASRFNAVLLDFLAGLNPGAT